MAIEWEKLRQRRKGSFKVFDVDEIVYLNPYTSNEVPIYMIGCKDWVNVIATMSDESIVLIRQFRFGSNRVEVEIPGGIIETGEDPAIAAARELREETGYEGEAPVLIGRVNPNPALHHHACFTYLIENAMKTGEAAFDGPNEHCEDSLATIDEVRLMLVNGTITHALVIDAFFWYLLHSGKIST
ncbi:MAG TPA: NUDIX hydrolase [Candidatus Lokiarchaeia archaeon]|nr:NUDIX hydrolase [Candidatus Lokiarchaeia archaeon]